jgi:hypothetical protein
VPSGAAPDFAFGSACRKKIHPPCRRRGTLSSRCCIAASRLVVVASRRPIPLAPLVVALLRVSSLHRVSSSSHLVVALRRRVSLSDIERVDGIVHLPFEAVERAGDMKNFAAKLKFLVIFIICSKILPH